MQIYIETENLILRSFSEADVLGIYELDSDPEVHAYLGGNPIGTIEEAKYIVNKIRKQYEQNGIGRWAVLLKETGEFIGWSGLKLVNDATVNGRTNYYDLGYRFIKKYWGNSYATETARVALDYAFGDLGCVEVYATTDARNHASNRVLEKVGLKKIESFYEDGIQQYFYKIEKEDWLTMK
ncbi:MAG: GNAT family N-acetyltransferase [Saprospiraceae bacterium]|nr:GNAT family N-acetyltransferase [Saprospiraceae bacterium]